MSISFSGLLARRKVFTYVSLAMDFAKAAVIESDEHGAIFSFGRGVRVCVVRWRIPALKILPILFLPAVLVSNLYPANEIFPSSRNLIGGIFIVKPKSSMFRAGWSIVESCRILTF
jgi:hypothetical protein